LANATLGHPCPAPKKESIAKSPWSLKRITCPKTFKKEAGPGRGGGQLFCPEL